ncbi:MAG: tRNA guanosine(34) transglycosylase Tgt [Polyangia bacterium]|jgi:queuine tRNA-ribosyltransferase|nr:tRNA guanosine(34) transglycosylase Tgt [Polyangia bacterium]
MTDSFSFEVRATCGHARLGRLRTPHGEVDTPAFMPVGTHGAVRAMSPTALRQTGARILLSNTLHLYLRPGLEVVDALGGLHQLMGWQGPILTDSGGFQLMSLASLLRIDDDGAFLASPHDGSRHRLTPALAMEIQRRLGVDIAMVLDHCPPADASPEFKREAMDRSSRWAARCLEQDRAPGQAVFGIVQGGTDLSLRREHLETIAGLGPDGLALGGLAVGEGPEEMDRVVGAIAPEMPADKPRYLMGVGYPRDLVVSARAGIDLFDCVVPTRHARNGQLFTSKGRLNIANARHRLDPAPIEEGCDCEACTLHGRAYLRHLYMTREILYSVLATAHNLTFYQRLMGRIREAIQKDDAEGLEALERSAEAMV